ncbi:MAG: DUF952 domain-containing protein [Aeromicrobium sp.]
MRIYHLATAGSWQAAQAAGTYTVSTIGLELAEVGFIHCSQAEQVAGVHERFYADVTEPLVLLTIDTDRLSVPWQLDDVPGQASPFPHIYGPLSVDAVVTAEPFPVGDVAHDGVGVLQDPGVVDVVEADVTGCVEDGGAHGLVPPAGRVEGSST